MKISDSAPLRALKWANTLRSIAVLAFWMISSISVIVYNRYMLTIGGFPYPILLTLWHMFYATILSHIFIKTGIIRTPEIGRRHFFTAVIPIGALSAVTLWVGNAAYIYLSVSFIQMLKAFAPVAVYLFGCILGTEKFDPNSMLIVLLIAGGVGIACTGEIKFNLPGFLFQMASVFSESLRLVLVQILLQSRGITLNPVASLYFVAPCSFLFLLLPFFVLEFEDFRVQLSIEDVRLVYQLLANATAAFVLNIALFLLIGNTSALTVKVTAIMKDWVLIAVSQIFFNSTISNLNIAGYTISMSGICLYNIRVFSKTR